MSTRERTVPSTTAGRGRPSRVPQFVPLTGDCVTTPLTKAQVVSEDKLRGEPSAPEGQPNIIVVGKASSLQNNLPSTNAKRGPSALDP